MTDPAADYGAYAPTPTSNGELSQLSKLADEQIGAESEVADLEAQLTKAREKLRDLKERRVPELMDAIGIAEFKTSSGVKIKVKETIRAAIPAAAAPRAFAWLKEHGNSSLIKRALTLAFGRGEDEKADALAQSLEAQGFNVEDKASVHPSTLSAFVREKLADGEELPLDLFGVHRQRVAEITS